KRTPDRSPKLHGPFNQTQTSNGITSGVQRAQLSPGVSPHALFSSGIESLGDRQILFGSQRLGETDFQPACEDGLPAEEVIFFRLCRNLVKALLPTPNFSSLPEGKAHDLALGWIEWPIGSVPHQAEG